MSEQNQIEYSLTVSTEMAATSVKKLEANIIRCLGYAGDLAGGDSDIQKGIQKTTNLAAQSINVFRTATLTVNAFKAAAGPISWFYFGISALTTGITYGHMMTEIGE